MKAELLLLYQRDLLKLKEEIEAYQEESNLWRLEGQIKNTPGNLALHLCGNLQHFVGHVLGGSNYERNREAEFTEKNIARSEIIKEIETTLRMLKEVLPSMDEDSFSQPFPIQVFKDPFTIFQMIVHLQGHLNYHLGQINYHRRMIES